MDLCEFRGFVLAIDTRDKDNFGIWSRKRSHHNELHAFNELWKEID